MEPNASTAPGRLAKQDVHRIRMAAMHVTRIYPGPVGLLLARELRAYADFGYRFGTDGLIERLTAEVMASPALPPAAGPVPLLRRPAA